MRQHIIKTILRVGIFKTLYLNYKLLPFRQAIKLPIIVSRQTTLESVTGKVIIEGVVKPGLIKFGFFNADFYSWKAGVTLINIKGTFKANGEMHFGVGCSVVVDEHAWLEIGGNTRIGGFCKIICREKIVAGENFRLAWESQVIDTNFHFVKEIDTGRVVKRTKPITIGRNNWVGNRTTLMPGTVTPDFLIIASGSLCNKNYAGVFPEYSLVGGSPLKLLRTGLYRVMDKEEKEIEKLFTQAGQTEVFASATVKPG